MIHYFLRAYLDDYNLINCEIDKTFCSGHADHFYLCLDEQITELSVESVKETATFFWYKLRCPDIEIGKAYEVLGPNAYRSPLIYRFIVKKKKFNDDFYYDGQLGSKVEEGKTTFTVWSPTSSSIQLFVDNQYYQMNRFNKGVYQLSFNADLTGKQYYYLVNVNGEFLKATDPYCKTTSANSKYSIVTKDNPVEKVALPVLESDNKAVIYETSVADYTSEGSFKAMEENVEYFKYLGFSHLQLLPVNDYGSVEDYDKSLYYNWGYDPVHYMALQQSYSSEVTKPEKVNEDFKSLVKTLHTNGIKVNLDVVFNHHYYADRSNFQALVPYYYFRYKNRKLAEATGCGNEVDTAALMARKLIVDTLVYFVKEYDVDGFRFDLMGFIDIETMNLIIEKLTALKPDIMLYGEGWEMNAAAPKDSLATLNNYTKFDKVGFFNPEFRDIIKGNTFNDGEKGYASGNSFLAYKAVFAMNSNYYGGPNRSINYIECHDDLTCYDKLKICCADENSEMHEKRMKIITSCVLLSKGISFIHGGQEFCLSKRGSHNTYNVGPLNKFDQDRRIRHKAVTTFTADLINFSREYSDDIYSIIWSNDNGVLIGKCDNLVVLINGSDHGYILHETDKKRLLFSINGKEDMVVDGDYHVEAVSIAIMGK